MRVYQGCTPLWFASEKGHPDVARLLIDKAADIDMADCASKTPVHVASQTRYLGVARLLVDKGASVVCECPRQKRFGHVDPARSLARRLVLGLVSWAIR